MFLGRLAINFANKIIYIITINKVTPKITNNKGYQKRGEGKHTCEIIFVLILAIFLVCCYNLNEPLLLEPVTVH